ncbi:MAG TPA: response regulator [Gemmatimonadales bacterium]|nr:response regulator [Gemmatimonadales bacterium]
MPARPSESFGRDLDGACILVIDDEAGVRSIVRRMLRDCRCRVVEATDGFEGLATVEREAVVDLVLTDLSMPRIGGLAVLESLGRRRPEIPVIVMSGNSAAMNGMPQVPVLRKPFTADELLALITDLLTRVRPAALPAVPPSVRPAARSRYRAPPL